MMYKIINDVVSSYTKSYFISPDPPLRRGYYKQLPVFTGIDSYKFSFIPSCN